MRSRTSAGSHGRLKSMFPDILHVRGPTYFIGKWLTIWLMILAFGQGLAETATTSGEGSVKVKTVRAKDVHAGDRLVIGTHRYPINEVHIDNKKVLIVYKAREKFERETYNRMHRVKITRTRA